MTTRIHPGYAALSGVVILTAVLLFVQSLDRKTVTQVSQPITPPKQAALSVRHGAPSPLSGIARVIDGDTIDIRGTRIRLDGIDAPESKQTCEFNSASYPCGVEATEALIKLLGARPVECLETGTDRNQRVIARCRIDSIDVGTWLVENGWAIAFRKYSMAYVEAEERARSAKAGIWAGTFVTPSEWRRQKR